MDRDCNSCINHTANGCRKWNCEYEKLMSIQDAILALRMVKAHGIADKAKETAIRSLEAWKEVINHIDILIKMNSEGENISEQGEGMIVCMRVIKNALGEVTEDEQRKDT